MAISIRRKRVILPAIATVAVLAGGGAAWAAYADEKGLEGSQRDRAGQAALTEVGGGRVLEAEADDEGGERLYEVEVVDTDGVAWDVVLDEEFAVVLSDRDDADDADDLSEGAHDLRDDAADLRGDADDAPVSAAERDRVGAAAAAAVPAGKVVDVDRGDQTGVAWEVEVVDGQGRHFDVTLDERLDVLATVRD